MKRRPDEHTAAMMNLADAIERYWDSDDPSDRELLALAVQRLRDARLSAEVVIRRDLRAARS